MRRLLCSLGLHRMIDVLLDCPREGFRTIRVCDRCPKGWPQ